MIGTLARTAAHSLVISKAFCHLETFENERLGITLVASSRSAEKFSDLEMRLQHAEHSEPASPYVSNFRLQNLGFSTVLRGAQWERTARLTPMTYLAEKRGSLPFEPLGRNRRMQVINIMLESCPWRRSDSARYFLGFLQVIFRRSCGFFPFYLQTSNLYFRKQVTDHYLQ